MYDEVEDGISDISSNCSYEDMISSCKSIYTAIAQINSLCTPDFLEDDTNDDEDDNEDYHKDNDEDNSDEDIDNDEDNDEDTYAG